MKKSSPLVLTLVVAGVLSGYAQERADLFEKNRFFEAELSLAKIPGTYMIIDIGERTVSLKARGQVLRKWTIARTRSWGKSVPLKVFKMEKKSALSQPERPNITPGKEDQKTTDKEKKDSSDLGVLELKDMPVHFSLHFGQNVHISVKPRTKRFWPTLLNVGKTISWHTILPLKTLWFALRKKSFTEIELVMPSEKDAQAIYWSFLDGHSTLIFQPSR
ncbi:MAG: hypothetical protein NTU60_03325 [Candidatus Aminicenantes bacterium]|nr:hypothetical protein [Candidatus Aminicenantes bacterium]